MANIGNIAGACIKMEHPVRLNPDDWLDQYGDALFRFALARVKTREIAEDLVQEVFISAVQAKERFEGKSSEKTWLFSILKHKIIDHFRRNKAFVLFQDYAEDPDRMELFFNSKGGWKKGPTHWRFNPGKALETKEFLDHFYRCLAGLPKRTADVFIHRVIDGLSTGEICKQLEITENNCWVILYRARMMLRKCLEQAGFDRESGESS
jgi:RNA polymerase sigma-70 factor (TIGR02943 family)